MNATEIADAMARIIHPDQVTELRALHCGGPRQTTAGWFDGRHLFDLARTALALTRQSRGVYFVPNPVHPDLLARCPNRVENIRRDKFHLTTDDDVLERRFLFLDLDPDRSDGNGSQPSNDDELELAKSAAGVVIDDLVAAGGWANPLRMMSGNGVHLLFPLSGPIPAKLPAYQPDPCREVLALCGHWKYQGRVSIDPNTWNAVRMLKVPGTWARKGEPSAGRPYRTVEILEFPNDWPAPRCPPDAPGRIHADVRGVQPRAQGAGGADGDRDLARRPDRRREASSSLFDADAALDPR